MAKKKSYNFLDNSKKSKNYHFLDVFLINATAVIFFIIFYY